MLDGIALAFFEGESAEAIWQQYPAAALEEVYGAIAFILAHRDEVDAYLLRQDPRWNAVRDECGRSPSPLIRRLRAARLKNSATA